MTILLIIVYVLVCLFLIMVVLLQQGKGADLAGAFGGGGSQTSFGPRSGANLMHRMTTGAFVLFVVLSMTLAILSGKARISVMEDVGTAPTPAAGEEQPPVMDSSEEAVGEEVPPVAEGEAATEEGIADEAAEQPAADEPPPAGN